MSFLFGRPKTPKMPAIPEVEPIIQTEKIQQTPEDKQAILKNLAKRRRATVLSQLTAANIKTQTLGAATQV